MQNQNYCKRCNETLVLHADGSIACSCDFLDTFDTAIPQHWQITVYEVEVARAAEIATQSEW